VHRRLTALPVTALPETRTQLKKWLSAAGPFSAASSTNTNEQHEDAAQPAPAGSFRPAQSRTDPLDPQLTGRQSLPPSVQEVDGNERPTVGRCQIGSHRLRVDVELGDGSHR